MQGCGQGNRKANGPVFKNVLKEEEEKNHIYGTLLHFA